MPVFLGHDCKILLTKEDFTYKEFGLGFTLLTQTAGNSAGAGKIKQKKKH